MTYKPVRIRLTDAHRTLGAMPYGAIADFEDVDLGAGGSGEAELTHLLATNLERLRVTLVAVAESNEKQAAELAALRRHIASLDELGDCIARYKADRDRVHILSGTVDNFDLADEDAVDEAVEQHRDAASRHFDEVDDTPR